MNFITALLLVLCSSTSWGQQPGIQVQVNSRGIDLARKVATKALEGEVRKLYVPNQSISSKASISNFRLNYFDLGATNARTSSPNIFHISTTKASLSVTSDVRYRQKIVFFTTTLRGTVHASAGDVSISTDFFLGRDIGTGRPTLMNRNCRVSLGNFRIRLSGSILAHILNLFVGFFRNRIRRELEKQSCDAINTFIRKYNNEELSTFDVYAKLDGFKSNLAQVRNPRITSSGVTVFFNGQFFSGRLSSPPSFRFQAPVVPTLLSTSKMAQILISEYVLNTLLYTIWKEGKLNATIPNNKIENALRRIGQNLGAPPNIGNERLEIQLYAARSPRADISSSGIEISTPFRITFNAGAGVLQVFTVNLVIRASLRIVNNGIAINRDNVIISLGNGDDEIAINVQGLLAVINDTNVVNDQFIAVYDSAVSGFQPFEKFNYFFQNPTVQQGNGYIVVGSDFVFDPSGRSRTKRSIQNFYIEGN